MDRRNFFKKSALAGVAGLSIPEIVKAAMPEVRSFDEENNLALSKGEIILFQGDSITDAGRKRDQSEANLPAPLGGGYALYAAANL